MYQLLIDRKLCEDCGKCKKDLPGFRTTYDGKLLISNKRMEDIEVRMATDNAKRQCTNGAIKLIIG